MTRPRTALSSWTGLLGFARRAAPADDLAFGYLDARGHLFEWSRLLVHLDAALADAPSWVVVDGVSLFDTAMRISWEADGRPGLACTLDWQDRPAVTERMHWVAIEATLAANVLTCRTGEDRFDERRLRTTVEPFIEPQHGDWHHELDASGAVSTTVWSGKPDAYHAVQGMLVPDVPLMPASATSVLAGASSA